MTVKSKEPLDSEQTKRTKQGYFTKHIEPAFGNKKIEQLLHKDIQNFVNEIYTKKPPNKNTYYTPKTVENIFDVLAAMFSYAIKNKYIVEDDNPCKNVELQKYDNTREYPLTFEESARLFNTILNFKEPLYRHIFTFLLHGRRVNEVLSMEWGQINFEQDRQGEYFLPYKKTKGRKNLYFPLSDTLLCILNEYPVQERHGLIFKSPKTGEKIQDLRKAWTRIKTEAGIKKHFTIHNLRHLIGHIAVNEVGSSFEQIAKVLGQTTTYATEIYSKVSNKTVDSTLEKVFNTLKQS